MGGHFSLIKRQSILTGGYYKKQSLVNDYQDTELSSYFHYQFHTLKFFQFWLFRKIFLCEKLINYFDITYFSQIVLSKTLRTSIVQVGKFHRNSEVQIL
jgi:hypothetical protein